MRMMINDMIVKIMIILMTVMILIGADRSAEVNISPKISISAQPLKMALHRNPAMHGSRMVIFLHDSKKALFLARLKALFLHNSKGNSLNLHDII